MLKRLLFILFLTFIAVRFSGAQTNACREGDTNHDGKITLADFETWRRIFKGGSATGVPTQSPTQNPADTINIVTFGATPNDSTDDTQAIQNALNSATAGKTVIVPPGTFNHNNFLKVPAGVTFKSEPRRQGTLKATNIERQSVILDGDSSKIIGLTFLSTATVRGGIYEHHRIILDGGSGNLVQDNHINGSTATGMYIYGASNYQIKDNLVENTLADGIHNTAGSNNGLVDNNTINTVGDDSVAVVSYVQDGQYTHHITITNNESTNGKGRGYAVVGGTNVTIENNKVTNSRAAGIYITGEDSYQTYGSKDILVKSNTIDQANYEVPLEHAGIFMYGRSGTAQASGQTVSLLNERVRFEGNIVKNTKSRWWHVAFIDANSKKVELINTTITGATDKDPFRNSIPSNEYNATGNTFNGVALPNHTGFTP